MSFSSDLDKSKSCRRSLLKKAAGGIAISAAGTTLPKQWTKPVVDSITLPAHAQTSGTTAAPSPAPISCSAAFITSIQNSPFPPPNFLPVSVSGQLLSGASGVTVSITATTTPTSTTLTGMAMTNATGAFGPVRLDFVDTCLLGNLGGPIAVNLTVSAPGVTGSCITTFSKGVSPTCP